MPPKEGAAWLKLHFVDENYLPQTVLVVKELPDSFICGAELRERHARQGDIAGVTRTIYEFSRPRVYFKRHIHNFEIYDTTPPTGFEPYAEEEEDDYE